MLCWFSLLIEDQSLISSRNHFWCPTLISLSYSMLLKWWLKWYLSTSPAYPLINYFSNLICCHSKSRKIFQLRSLTSSLSLYVFYIWMYYNSDWNNWFRLKLLANFLGFCNSRFSFQLVGRGKITTKNYIRETDGYSNTQWSDSSMDK